MLTEKKRNNSGILFSAKLSLSKTKEEYTVLLNKSKESSLDLPYRNAPGSPQGSVKGQLTRIRGVWRNNDINVQVAMKAVIMFYDYTAYILHKLGDYQTSKANF